MKQFLKLLIFLICIISNACFPAYMDEKEAQKKLRSKPYPVEFKKYRIGRQDMFYAQAGVLKRPLVIFVHGSPGSWNAFAGYLDDDSMVKFARLVSVDRPGYGRSGPGRPERSLEKQAAALKPILDSNKSNRPAILVGHSMGGPIIARMAMDFPDQVGGLIFVAASIDPELEKTKFIQYVARWPIIRYLVPEFAMVSNEEIFPLKGELIKMLPLWKNIKIPVTVIQGEDDGLVPPENAEFARRWLVNAPTKIIRIPKLNHFVPWKRPDLIKTAIREHLGRLK